MKKQRKHYTPVEKVAILRRHLLEKEPISKLCDEQGLQPTVFYRWQKEFFENGAAAFDQKKPSKHSADQKRIAYLEKKIQTKDEVPAELMAEHVALKKNVWGTLTGVWVSHDTRDQIVDFVRRWSERTEISAGRFIKWLDITASKLYDWRDRYGKVNEHNGCVRRDFCLEDWEKQAIVGFHLKNPLEGYPRLTFMMLDAEIVAASRSSVWRVLSEAGLLSKWNGKPSKKGTGFAQPLAAHQHWHIDVSYLNTAGTFYYLCSILDGFSRYIVNWDIRKAMTEADIEIILQGAKEKYPEVRPRIISDNGPQFIAKDSKEFIRISGTTHVRTSPFYPQSNGKIERLAQIPQVGVHPAGNAAVVR
jgi:transposase-like protein